MSSRRVAYSSEREGAWHLFLYDFGTRAEIQLTKNAASDVAPRWSPDGRRIAFVRGGRALHVLDVAAGTEKQIIADASLSRPPFVDEHGVAWSPDGRWLAYVTSDGANAQSAVATPEKASMPVAMSMKEAPARIGPPPGSPVIAIMPEKACSIRS